MAKTACEWCQGSDEIEPETLCDMHRAEYLGCSLDSLLRGEAIQEAEYQDTLG